MRKMKRHKVAKKLKSLKRPVIIRPGDMVYREQDRITLEDKDTFVPKVLSDAKVDFAIGGTTQPWYDAARLVRNGIDREQAIKAVTINAAKAIGLEHLIGSIEKGKMANLLVLSGDPLDSMTWVESVFVQGHHVYDRSKDKRLRELMDGIYETEKADKKAAQKKPEGAPAKSPADNKKPGAAKKAAGGSKSKKN